MQRVLRAVAYATNGLLVVVPVILALLGILGSHYKFGVILIGIAVFAAVNLYVIRGGVQSQVEQAREYAHRQKIAQRDSFRKLSISAERVVIPARLHIFLMGWLVCVGFVALALLMYHVDGIHPWPAVIFGVGVFYFPVAMMPGASYIEINELGVVFSSAFIKRRYPWFRIADLEVIPYMRREGVGFRFKPEYQKQSAYQIWTRKILGGFDNVIVSYHCGIEASELLRIMKNYYNRSLNDAAMVDVPVSPKTPSH